VRLQPDYGDAAGQHPVIEHHLIGGDPGAHLSGVFGTRKNRPETPSL
jgi:hypothetical protein